MARASGPRRPAGGEAAAPGPGGPRAAPSAPPPRPSGPLRCRPARSAAAGPGWARAWTPRAERGRWGAQARRRPGPALRAAMLASSSACASASASSGPRGRASAPGSGPGCPRLAEDGPTGSPESGTGGGRLRLAARNVPEVPRPSVRPSPDGGSPRLAPRSCSEAPPDFSPRLARPRPHPIPGGIHWVAAAPRLQRGLKHAAVPKEIRPPRCLKYSPTPTSIPAHTRRMDPPGPKITPTDPDPDPSTCHGNHPSRAEMDSQPSLNVPSVTGHLPPPNMTERYQTLNTEKP
ncbi:translation initiation factor IF-2-like [Mustela putorius furo]|uniref:Translation initiation factor IF-2-like n=1 Tax=Mustela putorius furo TaxID=9669 RepID=A0A8U0UKX7_MUSPF|nr:translation initiation factor IF-2-like [Mustela putorius furo]